MFAKKLFSVCALFLLSWSVACNALAKEQNVYVGSIPGDLIAKKMLAIDASEKVDFIRLRMVFNEGDRKFELGATYGIGKPNTRDFENGGKAMSARGQLEIVDKGGYLVYRLFNKETGVEFSLIRLNDNLFHVLSRDGRLMSGNGGWNYTFSREIETKSKSGSFPKVRNSDSSDIPETITFVGRTPCAEIAREMKITGDDCFKLKWKLTLHRNQDAKAANTFLLQRTFRRSEPLEGSWQIFRDANAIIYKLEGNDGSKMSFLRLDNSLFFLDNAGQLLKGNGEFGYTLDRQRTEKSAGEQEAKME